MKSSKIIIPILIIAGILLFILALVVIVVVGIILFLIVNKNTKVTTNNDVKVEVGELIEFRYSPGYSDMDGESHHESLKKNENGEWIIESRDCISFGEPMIVTVYSVSDEDVADFEKFIKDNNICGLENRPDSDEFITDYSSWGYGLEFDNSFIGGDSWESYDISEYKEYSDKDYELIKELRERFKNMHGSVISETEETDY
ncbi:MAG: hypothetical protein K6G75_08195 [Lachnospiraceae bacterium]|nr:hypothetical protein [Lachnospiraceae bacterium]